MTADWLGRDLGEYRLEALLGQGGMARVYRAVDLRLKRLAVVKVIAPDFQFESDYRTRFEREAQAIAQLDHPHIVRLYRFDEAEGCLYMAMQYIDGADLGRVMASYRETGEFIETADASRIVGEVCLALDYAHRHGVIHRDVKPANIMLDRQGRAILTDFGLALLAEVGTRGEIFGSPGYIAPEQAISSARAVSQSDLYSVGIILYEMFTGQLPFVAQEPLDVALMHINEPPRPPRELRPEISPELEAVILKALAKKPVDRYATGADLTEAIAEAFQAKVAPAPTRTVASRPTIPERVAFELAGQPVLALPTSAPATSPPAAPKPASPLSLNDVQPRRRPMGYGASGIMIVLGTFFLGIICVTVVVAFALLSGNARSSAELPANRATPTTAGLSTGQSEAASPIYTFTLNPTLTFIVAAASETAFTAAPTSSPTLALSNSPTPAPPNTPLPPPTETPIQYELLIVKGEDASSLIVVNQSSTAFPVAPPASGRREERDHWHRLGNRTSRTWVVCRGLEEWQ